jgi:hypothetical protein
VTRTNIFNLTLQFTWQPQYLAVFLRLKLVEIDYTSFEEGDKVAEKKLDIALGQDEGKKKGKAAAPALKKGAIPMKAKGKGKNIKHAVKKATDKTTDPNATVALDAHLDQDDIVKQEKVKLDPLLQLEDDEEIDWDSDLDVDGNRTIIQ